MTIDQTTTITPTTSSKQSATLQQALAYTCNTILWQMLWLRAWLSDSASPSSSLTKFQQKMEQLPPNGAGSFLTAETSKLSAGLWATLITVMREAGELSEESVAELAGNNPFQLDIPYASGDAGAQVAVNIVFDGSNKVNIIMPDVTNIPTSPIAMVPYAL